MKRKAKKVRRVLLGTGWIGMDDCVLSLYDKDYQYAYVFGGKRKVENTKVRLIAEIIGEKK